MKNLFKPFVMMLLIGMTFLSGSARNLLTKTAQAEADDGTSDFGPYQGGSCG